MAGKLHIWNMALGWLGTRTISAEDERTHEAIQCQLFWDSARRQCLRDYPWSFAKRRAWLAALSVPEGWEQEYSHAYALPTDCVKTQDVRNFLNKSVFHALAHHPEAGRQTLLCSEPQALLIYTADVVDAALFDDNFSAVLARKMAALMATPLLRNNSSKVKEMEELYRMSIPTAVEADASEGKIAPPPDSWLAARSGFGGAAC